MKKRILSLALAGMMMFTMTACTKKDVVPTPEEVVLEEKLVIYSTHPEALLEFAAAEFETATGVKVEFLNLKGELANRIIAEKENPQADIMYGAASSVFIEMQQQDIFEKTAPSWAGDLKDLFKDKDGYWYGTMQTPVMLFYNNEMLTEEQAPKDWYDLNKPEYKDLLTFRNALSSSAKATFSSILYNKFEKEGKLEEGWTFMKEMDANTKKYFGSESLQMQAIGRKEAAISFAPLNSIIDNREKNNLPLTIVDAESGSVVITDAVGMIKGAPHPNAAQAFIEFIGSPEMQAKLANEFNRMPTLDAALETSPEWMKSNTYKAMDIDWKVLSENQSTWMQKWDTEIKDAKKDIAE